MLELHPFLKQLVDDGDGVVSGTINDIAIGHGLESSDLDDVRRYPDERDVFDQKVNVRLMARLLRIGDLLDLNTDRADPLRALAVGPLPASAVPHWRQYGTKIHENVCSDVIEFTFECNDQETHRVLVDWFSWLEEEIGAAGIEQLHARRHSGWKPPRCVVDRGEGRSGSDGSDAGTIVIRPTAAATYRFYNWRLELDEERILERLIEDVSGDEHLFIEELLQNALDATRCRMSAVWSAEYPGRTCPARLDNLPEDFRERYPIRLTLNEEEVAVSADGPIERCNVLTIEDLGIGMTEEVVRKYFLQVGRSFYSSEEFRTEFSFTPISRFGIGFLSVFSVSSDVTVETIALGAVDSGGGGIRLRLKGPRNYMLIDQCEPMRDWTDRSSCGTRIRVVLQKEHKELPLEEIIENLCVAVEVPVIVTVRGDTRVIRSTKLTDRAVLGDSSVDPCGRFVLRVFDHRDAECQGQLAVIAYEDDEGEGWCDCWSGRTDLGGHRIDSQPDGPLGFVAYHGLKASRSARYSGYGDSRWRVRCDVRSGAARVGLSKLSSRWDMGGGPRRVGNEGESLSVSELALKSVAATAQVVVAEHLATSGRAKGKRGSYYIGKVLDDAPVGEEWRREFPASVAVWCNGKSRMMSVSELLSQERLAMLFWDIPWVPKGEPAPEMRMHPCLMHDLVDVAVSVYDVLGSGRSELLQSVRNMNLVSVRREEDMWLFVLDRTATNSEFRRAGHGEREEAAEGLVDEFRVAFGGELDDWVWLAHLGSAQPSMIAWADTMYTDSGVRLLNGDDPVVQWLIRARAAAHSDENSIRVEQVDRLIRNAAGSPWEVDDLVERWSRDSQVPVELKPPRNESGETVRFRYVKVKSRLTL